MYSNIIIDRKQIYIHVLSECDSNNILSLSLIFTLISMHFMQLHVIKLFFFHIFQRTRTSSSMAGSTLQTFRSHNHRKCCVQSVSSVGQWNLSDTAPQQTITTAILGFLRATYKMRNLKGLGERTCKWRGKIKTEFT